MKVYIAILVFCMSHFISFAQFNEKISYQAVIRSVEGEILVKSPVGVKIAIVHQDTNGSRVYEETHALVTNENGLVTMQIGAGNVLLGNFSTIEWSNGPFYIETQMDLTGGTDYSITGLTELLSVPYALYAKTAGAVASTNSNYQNNADIVSFENNRNINENDINNTIECTQTASLILISNFNSMAIGEVINLEAHNGAVLSIQAMDGVELNYTDGGSATFISNLGNVRFGMLRKIAENSYIVSGQ
ncbi:hypothetical protein [Maribacter litoralis]|uniref:Uncharacterized protein n=1 Tax=Maribacter litoralis TaxID=2059726 RepID=A0A653SF19_9FLAO|nr:hypothetical protein [Maribacter litoralis]VXB65316.1 conserved exported hypothetical protein [Maribacter litoralis]